MHRAVPASTSLRGYSAGGSRATINKMDDNSLMQACHADMQSNESRDAIECPQNYGFTSHNFQADKDEQGNAIASAESFASYQGGNRCFPAMGPVDDRRHRARGLGEGDSMINRGNGDDMQVHLASDGMYHSAPQMVRCQLVPAGSGKANPPQQKSQASPTKQSLYAKHSPTPEFEARLWAGLEPDLQLELDRELVRIDPHAAGGGSGGSGGGGGQGSDPGASKKTGQKAVNSAGKDSKDFMHVKNGEARLSSAKQVRLSTGKEDDDTLHESSSGKDYVGGTPAKHKFSKILTLAGPSINGYGRIG